MSERVFQWPVAVRYGAGILEDLGRTAKEAAGDGALLLVSDAGLEKLGLVDRVSGLLDAAGVRSDVVLVANEPTTADADRGAEALRALDATAIIAVGGGSSLDLGKAINVVAHNSEPVGNFAGFDLVPNGGVPLITVPTTAGTGSEVGSGFVLVDNETRSKFLVIDAKYWPVCSILDPELTVSLPPKLTAYTGLDALAQAMGAYVVTMTHPLVEAPALQAVRLLYRNIRRAADDGSDIEAREAMQLGSALAGCAMYNAECAADHAFGETIGAYYGIPHGLTVGAFLPHVTAHNAETAGGAYAALAAAMDPGWARLEPEAACDALVAGLFELNETFGIPPLREVGASAGDIPELTARTLQHFSMTINPRPFSEDEIAATYRTVIG